MHGQSRGGPPRGRTAGSGLTAGRRAYGIQKYGLRVPEYPKEDSMSKHVLAQNQYGKAENRIVKVTRKGNDGSWHEIRDLNVSVALRGEFRDVHPHRRQRQLPADRHHQEHVYAFGKEHGIESPEAFGILLAKHFVSSQAPIREAQIRIEEFAWERIPVPTRKEQHSFVLKGQEVRTAQITYSETTGLQVISGLKDLTVMNSTNSEFHGYIKGQVHDAQGGVRPHPGDQGHRAVGALGAGRRRPRLRLGPGVQEGPQEHAGGLRGDVLVLAPADPEPDGRARARQLPQGQRGAAQTSPTSTTSSSTWSPSASRTTTEVYSRRTACTA
ncbi:hypothetical protein Scinn_15680 [Streptomyces virginiae]|uniref:Uricase n=1 Tax=Streptomyces virginiae TaxID=1961 RepID=A0ABQ3NH53_STRVG|nr:hypothetical protein Scinn_15680 [Streptomyces virginiae]